MISRRITIINKLGLHARAAAKLIATTSRFQSQVRIRRGEREVDGKSIMSVMLLAASKGTELDIVTDGPDEAEAMEAVCALIDNRFEEDE